MIADRILDHLKHAKNDARALHLHLKGLLPDVNANNGAGAFERACLEQAVATSEKTYDLLVEVERLQTKGAAPTAPAEPPKADADPTPEPERQVEKQPDKPVGAKK